jgi:hypothetical protein
MFHYHGQLKTVVTQLQRLHQFQTQTQQMEQRLNVISIREEITDTQLNYLKLQEEVIHGRELLSPYRQVEIHVWTLVQVKKFGVFSVNMIVQILFLLTQ